jgi:hypothetical protein
MFMRQLNLCHVGSRTPIYRCVVLMMLYSLRDQQIITPSTLSIMHVISMHAISTVRPMPCVYCCGLKNCCNRSLFDTNVHCFIQINWPNKVTEAIGQCQMYYMKGLPRSFVICYGGTADRTR